MLDQAPFPQSASHVGWICDIAGSRWDCSVGWHRYTGMTREEVAGFGSLRAIHPGDLERFRARWTAARETGLPHLTEYRLRRHDGEYRWFRSETLPLQDRRGGLIGWSGVAVDIHDLKLEAESGRAWSAALPQMAWTARRDGLANSFSSELLAYTQTTMDELIGWGWNNVVHPGDVAGTVAEWMRAVSTGTPYETELRLLRARDKSYRWFLTRAQPVVSDAGNIEAWFGTVTDIERQKRHAEYQGGVLQELAAAFVPKTLPRYEPFALDAAYRPSGVEAFVGGDFYDALVLPDGRLLFTLGDVRGHGVPAALTLGRARSMLLAAAMGECDPARILIKTNEALRLQDDTMVTALVGFIDPGTETVRYACAGQNAPALATAAAPARLLRAYGGPLGVLPEIYPRTFEERLPPGALLVLYTDGATDYDRDLARGEARLMAAVDAVRTLNVPAHALLERLIGGRKVPDDVAFLTIAHR